MKKQYSDPKLEPVLFDDVIVTSGDPIVPDNDNTYIGGTKETL